MNKLLKSLIFGLFWSHVGGEGESDSEPVVEVDSELDSLEDDDEAVDPAIEDEEEELDEPVAPVKQMSRAQKEITTLRERAQKAEQDRIRAEAALEEARRSPRESSTQNSGTKTKEQDLWEQEEAVLKDPEAQSWHKYAIQSARDARAARAESQQASMNAADNADKSSFARLQATKPKTYAKYAPKVEDMLQNMRKNGANAPREELFALLIGRDLISGGLKTEKTKAKTGGVARGKTPGVKSDSAATSISSRMTEAEKRAKRLENVHI